MTSVRYPAVAGMFYEADAGRLAEQIKWSYLHPVGPGKLPQVSGERRRLSVGYVAPHAGYIYSGPVAAHTYYSLAGEGAPETVVIAGPNHTGMGSMVSVMTSGEWLTPLGKVEIDEELASLIVSNSKYAEPDDRAHRYEHSVEVQIPFLQHIFGDRFRIVPIVMFTQVYETAADLARAIHRAVEETGRDIVFIASTDFSHYVPYKEAYERDRLALQAIERLDARDLFRVVEEHDISMCGPGPTATLVELARLMGAEKAETLKYATSGDTSGDKYSVVGYASIRVLLS